MKRTEEDKRKLIPNASILDKTQHIQYLDGLRGVAAFIVVVHHFLVGFYPALHSGNGSETHFNAQSVFIESYFARTSLNVLYGGNFAVCIFFVLSGFVLSYKYFRSQREEVLVSYAVKRYIRLFIPVFFSIVIVFIMIKLSLFFNQEAAVITKSDWWLKVLWNINPTVKGMLYNAFIDVFLFNNNSYNTALWTMKYELFGSLLVFSFVFLISKVRKKYVFYGLACFIFYWLQMNYYIAFIAGVALCDIYNNSKNLHRLNNPGAAILLLCIGLFFASYPPVDDINGTMFEFLKVLNISDPYSFYHIVGAFFVLLVFISYKTIQTFFSKKPFLFMGKISFSMYLLHAPVMGSLGCFLFIKLNSHLSYHVNFLVTFMISIAVLFVLSFLMAKYVDEFAMRFSEKIYLRYFKLTEK